jgi:hypothetical protein
MAGEVKCQISNSDFSQIQNIQASELKYQLLEVI